MVAFGDGPVDRPPDRRRQRHQHDLAAFPDYTQNPVPMFLTDIADVCGARFEHP